MKKILLALVLLATATTNAQIVSEMYYHKGKVYNDNSYIYPIPSIEIEQTMYKQSAFLYDQYKTGKGLKSAGAILLGVGVPTLVTGVVLVSVTYADLWFYRFRPIYDAGWALFGIGASLTTAGIPLYSVGLNKMHNAINAYNKEIKTLTVQLTRDGVGLALNF